MIINKVVVIILFCYTFGKDAVTSFGKLQQISFEEPFKENEGVEKGCKNVKLIK